jgi:AraC-like DNA-binding protein
LRKYSYPPDIFEQIKMKFAGSYAAIAFQKRVVESIIILAQQFITGQITIEQFNEEVKISETILAELFARDYHLNYVRLGIDIQKYKYLLE